MYNEDIWNYSILARSDVSIGFKMILREWSSNRSTSLISIQHHFRKLRHGEPTVDHHSTSSSPHYNSCSYSISSGKNRVQFHIAGRLDYFDKNGVLLVVLVAFFIMCVVFCQY